MSLILEALRKSEAERQRGRAPGLFVEQVPAQRRGRRAAPAWPWGLAALLAAGLLAWAWREWPRSTPSETVASPSVNAAAAAPERPSALTPGMNTPATTASADPATSATTALAGIDSPDTSAPPAMDLPAPAPPPRMSSPSIAAAPVPAARAAVPAPDPMAGTRPAEPPQTATPAAAPAPDASSASAPHEPALPTVASLAAGERAQLPPLKLSMHVYAAEPAQRFVILDGQRLGEGASPAPGLVLEHIRRDGLVLLVNGRRVLLARP